MKTRIKTLESCSSKAFGADRHRIRSGIFRLKRSFGKVPEKKMDKWIRQLENRLKHSIKTLELRKKLRPKPIYNKNLPIAAKKEEIINAIINHPVVIISGETGSGKTTQIPKFCLGAGRGIDGIIGCTQPRRIAATTVSMRIAEEQKEKLGLSVGYKIRFKDKTGPNTFIKIMTDGILLAETRKDPFLNEYDTIIVDEAHERSLNIDFILGILKRVLKKRKDLKLIITSATIDTEKFSKAFNNAPVIEVSGRMYPVKVRYFLQDLKSKETDEQNIVETAVHAINDVQKKSLSGDILVFMPTEQDIRETCDMLKGKDYKNVIVFPLFARLSAWEQSRVFKRISGRKIIVATNIAETSLTIPGIKYVIDTGLARISRYSPGSRTTSLPVTSISQSSADQRKGRCGRVEDGVCIRLYSEEDYQARPVFTPPEILRANLADVILRMIALNAGNVEDFPFIDRPAPKSIRDGFNLLFELGAIRKKPEKKKSEGKSNFVLTGKGKLMAQLPVDPRLSRMLIEAQKEGCLDELKVIAAALSIQDPRERPVEKTQEADIMHKSFFDPSSDFLTLLNIWKKYHQITKQGQKTSALKRFCKSYYLSFKRMREWHDIYGQLTEVLKEYDMGEKNGEDKRDEKVLPDKFHQIITEDCPLYGAIHRSVLSGFLSNIGLKKEKNIYQGAKDKEVMIFPGSALFDQAKTWIVAAQIVKTSRIFARICANIDVGWLEELGKTLCKYTHIEPEWEKEKGKVVASEQVSLFGLVIIARRPVSYGRINPDHATQIFIMNALIQGDIKERFGFMIHNQKLINEIKDMEDRMRRRDILVSDEELLQFYKVRLKTCYDIRTLKKIIKNTGGDQFLKMRPTDVRHYLPSEEDLSHFPDRINLNNQYFDCSYTFAPGKADDGVTVKIPSHTTFSVSPESMEWMVPGLYREKIITLIKGLPKAYRKQLVPVGRTVDIIVSEMPRLEGSLITALGEFIYKIFKVDIPANAWSATDLPDHLKMRISITGSKGEEILSGREPAILKQPVLSRVDLKDPDEIKCAREKWERKNITFWDFPDLPEHITIQKNGRGQWILYPALYKVPGKKTGLNLRLFMNADKALSAHKEGVCGLFEIHFSKDLKFLKKVLKVPNNMAQYANYFGGSAKFEKRLYNSFIKKFFYKNIRSKNDFSSHVDTVSGVLLLKGRLFLEQNLTVLNGYHGTRDLFYNIEAIHQKNDVIFQFIQAMRKELSALVPENFMDLYEPDRFVDLVRYMKAMAVRADRAMVNFEKDRVKEKEIKPFVHSLKLLLKNLSPETSPGKRRAVEEYFWMIEEYKVSVFAQELKTQVPVSKKRLIKKLKEIERMA